MRDYVEEQTKLLHMYVVRNDLQDFRHLHPVLGKDGTWTARAALAGPGSYRVLAEFTPGTDPQAAHVVLGRNEIVPGSWEAVEPATESVADDGVVRVSVDDPIETGPDGRMRITVDDGDGNEVTLGSYLGSYAHVTGFELETGSFVHVHPYGEPEATDDGTQLTFHTAFDKPGSYRLLRAGPGRRVPAHRAGDGDGRVARQARPTWRSRAASAVAVVSANVGVRELVHHRVEAIDDVLCVVTAGRVRVTRRG